MADLPAYVAESIHSGKPWEGAQAIADFAKLSVRLNSETKPDKYLPILQYYLHELMDRGFMAEAARMLWNKTQFTPEPYSVREVWDLFNTSSAGLIMGAASLGKSFSLGVRLMLEWTRDPEWTSIRVVGPSEDHLEQNLFSHLVSLHNSAALPLPGSVGDLFIGLNRRDQISSIRGIVIPKGNSKKAGRLQGGHRKPRKTPHPKFGPLSRMFILIDEIENVPQGIWHDVSNVMSEINEDGGFKLFGVYNPSDIGAEVAKAAEPVFGWGNVNVDEHFKWKSLRGFDVLRLDAERCENVIQNKIIYPGLQTRMGLEKIAVSSGGRQSPGYLTMGRGMYPLQGSEITMIPAGMFQQWRGEYIWLESPTPVGGADLAFEGGDDCIYALGKFGLATGIRYMPSPEHPEGRVQMFKSERGEVKPRWGCQLESLFVLEKGDTVKITDQNVSTSKRAGVRPEYFACDRTGAGTGVADLIKNQWGAIHDVNYSDGASSDRMMVEDSKACNEQYDRMQTELWKAMRMWGEFGYFLIGPKVDTTKLQQQMISRRSRTGGGKEKVESKKDYMSRGFPSPNEADATTLLIHAARKGSGVVLSMRGESVLPSSSWDDDWPAYGTDNGVKIDPSNRSDFLDERSDSDALRHMNIL